MQMVSQQEIQPSEVSTSMRDVTFAFRKYRDAARNVWNSDLYSHPDREVEFEEVNRALLRALFTSYVSPDILKETPISGSTYFNDVSVRLPEASGVWLLGKLKSGVRSFERQSEGLDRTDLRLIGLADFDWTNPYRDFEYISCYVLTSDNTAARAGDLVWLPATKALILVSEGVGDWP